MKKLLALLLTLLMALSLCSAALADHVKEEDVSGGTCELTPDNEDGEHLQPGEQYDFFSLEHLIGIRPKDFTLSSALADDDAKEAACDSLYFPIEPSTYVPGSTNDNPVSPDKAWRVSASWDIGGAMVKTVKWDKDQEANYGPAGMTTGAFVVVLNENYTISELKRLEGTLTYTSKFNKDITVKVPLKLQVSNHLVTVEGYKKASDAEDNVIDASNNTLYQCDEDNPGYICFNDGRLLSCTLKMVKNEKAFMYNDEGMIDAIDEKYGAGDARIDCYNFGGSPKFTNDAQFKLQADYANQYKIYTWDGVKLTPCKYEWDSINGVYKWSTKTPGAYVISDQELIAADEAKDTAETKNPDTGAADMTGVAVALAAVSLLAGAAVSLRK